MLSEMPTGAGARQPPRSAAPLLYAGAAMFVLVVHLATNGTLGFHTDELYYMDPGRHPALGYVDFPPIVPLLARLETNLLGATPWDLRLLPTLLGAFMVVLSGAYVRRLGGSLRLQGLALLIAVTAPYFLGANWVYQTVTFDEVTWMVTFYWFLCLVQEHRPRYWIYLGLSLGIGFEVEYHDRRSGGCHRDRHPAYFRAALGPADAVSVDRGGPRAAHLGAESCVASCEKFSFAHLRRQPPGLRRRRCCQPDPDRGLSLLLDSALGGGIGVAVSQCHPAAHRDRVAFPARPFHVRGQVLLRGGHRADRTCSGAHGGRLRQTAKAAHRFPDRSRGCVRAPVAHVCSADAPHH